MLIAVTPGMFFTAKDRIEFRKQTVLRGSNVRMLYPKGRDDLNCIITREIITRDANTSDITGARARTYYNRTLYFAGVVKVNCLVRKNFRSAGRVSILDGINISMTIRAWEFQ